MKYFNNIYNEKYSKKKRKENYLLANIKNKNKRRKEN